jgi:hypothetical protein
MNPDRANIIFMLLMAAVIAISMKIVGVLLITAMLIIPAADRTPVCNGPRTDGVAGRGHRRRHRLSPASSVRWNGIRLPARASWSQRWACLSCRSCPGLFRSENPDVDRSTSAPSPRKDPVMNEHVHERSGPDQEPVPGDGSADPVERAAERLHHSRPASRQRVSRASPGLPGAGQAGGVRLVHGSKASTPLSPAAIRAATATTPSPS